MAEQQVAVGDGRLAAAAAVAGRAGIGAGALRATRSAPARSTQAIEPPPAEPREVDHRHRSEAGALHGRERSIRRRPPTPVAVSSGRRDQARLGGGAAHVEREQVSRPAAAHQPGRATPAAGPDTDRRAGMALAAVAASRRRWSSSGAAASRRARASRSSRARYGATSAPRRRDRGRQVRSNSTRARHPTRERRHAGQRGASRARAPLVAASRKLNSSHTATASTRAASSAATRPSISSSASGGRPRRRRRCARRARTGAGAAPGSAAVLEEVVEVGGAERRSSSTSRKPRVVIRRRARPSPRASRWSRWSWRATEGNLGGRHGKRRIAARARAARRRRGPGRGRHLGDADAAAVSSTRATSVNVPPMSTPIRRSNYPAITL